MDHWSISTPEMERQAPGLINFSCGSQPEVSDRHENVGFWG